MLTSSQVFFALGLASFVAAQGDGFVPLREKQFDWGEIPYKVDTDVGLPRGPQIGYNICNSTTEGPESLCQTAVINSLDDFCIWAPPEPGQEVGAIEGEMVAWCTRPGHGTRVIPNGTITGVQFVKSPDYIQVVGFMDQTKINMLRGDAGGEMDPHGADLRGNPMGGILYSQAFTGSYIQVMEWHNFNGADQFCLKACDPRGANDARFCEHIYDTQGCGFNAPSNARNGVFESCASDNQPFPGQGVQVPASSLCSTFASTDIYGSSATVAVPIPGASTMSFATSQNPPRSTSSAGSSGASSGASASRSGGASQPSQGSNDEGSALTFAPNVVLAVVAGLFTLFL